MWDTNKLQCVCTLIPFKEAIRGIISATDNFSSGVIDSLSSFFNFSAHFTFFVSTSYLELSTTLRLRFNGNLARSSGLALNSVVSWYLLLPAVIDRVL